ncbi:MAG: hypothetical protein ABSA59_15940 [Terriglobia bacterium]
MVSDERQAESEAGRAGSVGRWADNSEGRVEPATGVVDGQFVDENQSGQARPQEDVKNEECSSEFIENKGAKKVLLRSY